MRELRPGLWHWQAPHPEWTPAKAWQREVSSYAIDDGARLVLIDPQTVPEELLSLIREREPIVLLTAPWHERDTRSLVERLDAPVYTPPPDTTDDLGRKFNVTRERAAGGSPDLKWLLAGGGKMQPYAAGDTLPFGIQAFAGREGNDLVLWIEGHKTIISGDTLVDFGQGFQINGWLRDGITRAEVIARLRRLLALPVELVLSAHGAPTDRAALERALA
jgi:glyoxylase-like metal-dependent hydrolase (beta-lactamase superfamily II)